jgi:ribosomal protein L16
MPPPTSLLTAHRTLQASLQACRALLRAASHRPSASLVFRPRRPFSTTPLRANWLGPPQRPSHKTHKGRAHVPTGGSVRGSTVVWGQWGIRLASAGGRVSAAQLRIADQAIARSLRAAGAHGAYTVYRRVCAGVAVYTKGSDQRMGKGKGGFDYWAARVARGRVVFEVAGRVHEKVVREALRIAANKLPGEL